MKRLHNSLALVAGAVLMTGALACSEGSSSSTEGTGGASDGSGGSSDQGGGDQGGSGPTGSGGSTAGDLTEVMSFTFDADLEGFEVGWAESGGSQDTALQDATTLTWDSANGNPDPGAMSSTSPFAGPENKAQLQITVSSTDLTDGTVTAWIRLESGLSTDEANPGGAKLFVKSGSGYVWASGPWANLVEGEWTQLTLNTALPDYEDAGFDPSQIVQLGVEFETGGAAGDFWTSATVTVDTIVASVPAA